MKLWLLSRKEDDVDYDEYDSFVVLAEDEAEARKLVAAYDPPGYRKRWDWLDAETVECKQVSLRTKRAGILLGSYNAG